METLQDRLKLFINSLNITMQTFERLSGIAQGLGVRLSTKSYATTFKRISIAFPQLNIDWLKTGEGEMLLQDAGTPQITATITGNNNQIAGHDVNNADTSADTARFLQIIHNQSQQLDKAQAQIDRLLSIIEKLSK